MTRSFEQPSNESRCLFSLSLSLSRIRNVEIIPFLCLSLSLSFPFLSQLSTIETRPVLKPVSSTVQYQYQYQVQYQYHYQVLCMAF